jgi:hypothetical protein
MLGGSTSTCSLGGSGSTSRVRDTSEITFSCNPWSQWHLSTGSPGTVRYLGMSTTCRSTPSHLRTGIHAGTAISTHILLNSDLAIFGHIPQM